MSTMKCQMSNVNKVKLLSERTSGVPPVIFGLAEFPNLRGERVILNIIYFIYLHLHVSTFPLGGKIYQVQSRPAD